MTQIITQSLSFLFVYFSVQDSLERNLGCLKFRLLASSEYSVNKSEEIEILGNISLDGEYWKSFLSIGFYLVFFLSDDCHSDSKRMEFGIVLMGYCNILAHKIYGKVFLS